MYQWPKKIIFITAILSLCFSSFGLTAKKNLPSEHSSPHTLMAENEDQSIQENNQANDSEGEFLFEVKKNDEYANLYDLVKENGIFEKTIENLNAILKLPVNLHIFFDKSEDGSSYYQSSQKKIVLSYYRLNQIMSLYKKANPDESDEDIHEYGINAMRFIFYHELGHALIDIYKLPIVGDEETTADNLAAVLALELTPHGWDITTSAADFFDLLRQAYNDEEHESSYWDEHRMDGQRYYYILCLTYGKFPEETHKELKSYNDTDLLKFIEERGNRCRYDYQDSLNKWLQVLQPHFKKSLEEIKEQMAKENEE